jgi:hypothetical protein
MEAGFHLTFLLTPEKRQRNGEKNLIALVPACKCNMFDGVAVYHILLRIESK